MSVRILIGDCRESLRTLPENSVHTIVSSPPYYSLRSYNTKPVIWGTACCDHVHVWGEESVRSKGGTGGNKGLDNPENSGVLEALDDAQNLHLGQFCEHSCQVGRCAQWLGSLGLEPTMELYLDHLVECFAEAWRVLRDDGILWLNLGSSYAGSHGNGYQQTMHKVNYTSGETGNFDLGRNIKREDEGFKPKDLMMVPHFAAEALRQNGWYLRSAIPWVKASTMPESVRDRPASAIEYVFLMTKKKTYYYDAVAVRQDSPINEHIQRKNWNPGQKFKVATDLTGRTERNDGLDDLADRMNKGVSTGRSRRNSDWIMESLHGLLLDEDDSPLALLVNPTGFAGAHYAVFPPKLIIPMIKSSTSEYGVCEKCGAPWTRLLVKAANPSKYVNETDLDFSGGVFEGRTNNPQTSKGMHRNNGNAQGEAPVTTGWKPSCNHDSSVIPATVLDIFGGAGTTGLVADRLGRNAILCELSDNYSPIAEDRLRSDAPMFAEVEAIRTEELDDLNLMDTRQVPDEKLLQIGF